MVASEISASIYQTSHSVSPEFFGSMIPVDTFNDEKLSWMWNLPAMNRLVSLHSLETWSIVITSDGLVLISFLPTFASFWFTPTVRGCLDWLLICLFWNWAYSRDYCWVRTVFETGQDGTYMVAFNFACAPSVTWQVVFPASITGVHILEYRFCTIGNVHVVPES